MIFVMWLLMISPLQKEQFLDVFLAAFLPHNRSTNEQLTDYFYKKISHRLNNGQPICAAYVDNRMVGYAMFERWEDSSYYLAEMAVIPEYQLRGIGKQLVFSIFERDPSTKKILLITRNTNKGAQAFYEKIGFKPSSFQHPQYPEGFVGYEFSP